MRQKWLAEKKDKCSQTKSMYALKCKQFRVESLRQKMNIRIIMGKE